MSFLVFLCCFDIIKAKNEKLDSLSNALLKVKSDTSRIRLLNTIAWEWRENNPDTSIIICGSALKLSASFFRVDTVSFADYLLYNFPKNHKNDQFIIHALSAAISHQNIGVYYRLKGNFKRSLEYYHIALKLWNSLFENQNNPVTLRGISSTLGNMGIVYNDQGNFPLALQYLSRGLKIDQEAGRKKGISAKLVNIGLVYWNQGLYSKALENYFKALRIDEELGDKRGIAADLNNIGNIYRNQGLLPKALEFMKKAHAIDVELDNKRGQSIRLGNIGLIYSDMNDSNLLLNGIAPANKHMIVLDHYNKALGICEQIGDQNGIARFGGNIAGVFYYLGMELNDKRSDNERSDFFKKSLEKYLEVLNLNMEAGDRESEAMNLVNIGSVYLGMGLKEQGGSKPILLKHAEDFLKRGLQLSDGIGFSEGSVSANNFLSDLYTSKGEWKKSLEHFKIHILKRDSIFNEESSKKSMKAELNFEYEKKEALGKAEQERKDFIAEKEKGKQIVIRNSLIGGFSLVLLLAIVIFRGYRNKKAANEIIIRQKLEVEKQKNEINLAYAQLHEKNKEITDSIIYARRIQRALMTNEKYIRKQLEKLNSDN